MKALLFPGQGTQKIGMFAPFVSAFPIAQLVLDEIEDAVSSKISNVVENGSNKELSRTDNAQLAIFALGAICLNVLQKEYGLDLKQQFKYLAGHSLGEYTALYASGVFNLRDASRIVRKRGEIMAKACNPNQNYLMTNIAEKMDITLQSLGAFTLNNESKSIRRCGKEVSEACEDKQKYVMTAIVGKTNNDKPLFEILENLVNSQSDQLGVCVIANDNSNTQIVLSGNMDTVKAMVMSITEKYPALKAINLNTSGAFHSPLMGKSAIELDKYLLSFKNRFNDPQIPIISNVTVTSIRDKDTICDELVNQMVNKVRWRETIDIIARDSDIAEIVELCPGHVLTGMIKRDYPNMSVISLETISQIDDFMKR